ncbi:MAG: DRTGG domain-containing protein [Salinivirgaceae bacterium]|jgi:predicted transcriptional regulator|nr:DRTGG domain-containing protein [Salinivirgaceae bacterium]
MNVSDIVKELDLTVFTGEDYLSREIYGGYVSDLLSDVMGFSSEGDVWITLQTHKNVMAIASLKEHAAVILVKGFKPDQDTINHAAEEGIPILGTHKKTFEISGELYSLLKK